jgi:hypothetical protein
MGYLSYGVAPVVRIEDRLLLHLEIVITAKLRRGESFVFRWDQEPGVAEDEVRDAAHGTVWISPASQLFFRYNGPRDDHPLNRLWIEELLRAANSARGLYAVEEPAEAGGASRPPTGIRG